jgi:DNA-binding transcriptional MerR regulator
MIQMPNRYDDLMSIGQIARASGVAATALRYYEREGVLTPTLRSAAGYRLYDRRAVEQLEFIRSAQAVGFTLDDIRTLLTFDGGRERTLRKEVQELIEARLGQLAQKMSDLRRVQAALGKALKKCQHSDGECPVLKELHVHEATQRVRKATHGAKSKQVSSSRRHYRRGGPARRRSLGLLVR